MAKKITQAQKVRDYAAKHPNATIADIAKKMGLRYQAVYQVLKEKGTPKPAKQKWRVTHMSTSDAKAMPFAEESKRIYELSNGSQRMHPVTGKLLMQTRPTTREEKITNPAVYEVPERFVKESVIQETPKTDNVNHPAHYKVGGIETIDFIEAKNLSYHLGNVVKYIARADSKGNREEDLLKARWYLNREIAKFTKE